MSTKLNLKFFQEEPTDSLQDYLLDPYDLDAPTCQGGTGSGKTWIFAEGLRRAQQVGMLLPSEDKPFQQYTIFILCPSNAIVQHQRVLAKAGVTNCLVTSYDSLRSSLGDIYLKWVTTIERGVEHINPVWDEDFAPSAIICDESQYLKNFGSQRGKVIKAYIKQKLGKLAFFSATPFQKACEAEYAILGSGIVRNPIDFNQYALSVSPGGIGENSPAATNRIKEDLIKRRKWIQVKNVRYPFKPVLSNKLFDLTPAKRVIYDKAYERFLEERRKYGKNDPSGIIAKWNAMREFQMCSELLRADELAICAKFVKETHENSVIVPSNYIATLEAVKGWLIKMGVRDSEISCLYGNMPAHKKQESMDNFQIGRTRYFLTTLKSGGTGLNLQHCEKSSFPRTSIMPPCWSVYEFLQFLGRTQRIDNLSPARMFLTWYKDTVEEQVADRLEAKYDCIKTLYDRSDSFIQNIFNGEVDEDMNTKVEEESLDKEDGEKLVFDETMLDGEI